MRDLADYLDRMFRIPRWAAIGLAIAGIAVWLALWLRPDGVGRAIRSATGIATQAGVQVGGPFTLVDHTGRPVTDATWRGRWMLVYFGYTYCPDVCPTELQTIAAALDVAGPAGRAGGADLHHRRSRARHARSIWPSYVKLFDDRLVGLTGTPQQIAAVARAYRVYYAKVTAKDSATLPDGPLVLSVSDGAGRNVAGAVPSRHQRAGSCRGNPRAPAGGKLNGCRARGCATAIAWHGLNGDESGRE